MIQKKRVLIIDDDPAVLGVVKAMLDDNNYEGITAPTPQEGLEKARHLGPDIILLDLLLPDISGLGVLREMKRDPQLASIPVVVFTGLGDNIIAGEARDLGAVGLLTKNCSMNELISMMDKISVLREGELKNAVEKRHPEIGRPSFATREGRPTKFLWLNTPLVKPKTPTRLP